MVLPFFKLIFAVYLQPVQNKKDSGLRAGYHRLHANTDNIFVLDELFDCLCCNFGNIVIRDYEAGF